MLSAQIHRRDCTQRGGFYSKAAVAKADQLPAVLQGKGDFFAGKVALGTNHHRKVATVTG